MGSYIGRIPRPDQAAGPCGWAAVISSVLVSIACRLVPSVTAEVRAAGMRSFQRYKVAVRGAIDSTTPQEPRGRVWSTIGASGRQAPAPPGPCRGKAGGTSPGIRKREPLMRVKGQRSAVAAIDTPDPDYR